MNDVDFRLPDDKIHTLNFSGGRSSAYLLRKILDAYDGTLPKHILPIYANTGKEYDATLDFIHECESRWNVPIVWLEYRYDSSAKGGKRYPKNTFTEVNYATASRNGEPFEQLINSRGYLPNVRQRICTAELKVNTISRYMRKKYGLMKKRYQRVLGIRYDEPRRWGKALFENCDLVYPMVDAKVTKTEVNNYWKNSVFNLALDYDSIRGNCDLCYLKGRAKMREIMREDPNRAAWWIAQETKFGDGRDAVFMKDTTYYNLYKEVILDKQLTLDLEAEMDCFCGD